MQSARGWRYRALTRVSMLPIRRRQRARNQGLTVTSSNSKVTASYGKLRHVTLVKFIRALYNAECTQSSDCLHTITPFTPLHRVTSEVTVRVLAEVRVPTELRAYERRSGLEADALFADASSALIELP